MVVCIQIFILFSLKKIKNIYLVIVPVYNGGMDHIVGIKAPHLGELIQVLYVMLHINVQITISSLVHWVQHVNVQQLNTGFVKSSILIYLLSYIFLEWADMLRSGGG
jgi:hypothetical protein